MFIRVSVWGIQGFEFSNSGGFRAVYPGGAGSREDVRIFGSRV